MVVFGFKVDFQLSMADRIVHELNNFHDCIPEVSFFIVRGEVPIVKHSLVKKVLSMHLHELT